MKNPQKFSLLLVCCLLTLLAMPTLTFADWDEGMPYKWLQMPNPQGWDVCLMDQYIADDFVCTTTEAIEDIHFWISWQKDRVGDVTEWDVSIWDDAGGMPGVQLWPAATTPITTHVTRWYGSGVQGWICPGNPPGSYPDHQEYFQVNITDIQEPFIQEGTADRPITYWLVIKVHNWYWDKEQYPDGVWAGWKTSTTVNGSAAMYSINPLSDPWIDIRQVEDEIYDLSFVLNGPDVPDGYDFGDAPESDVTNSAIAYPSLNVLGHFPTCITMGSATSYISHNNAAQQAAGTIAWFGPARDLEFDGNAGLCPGAFPGYDQDECFADTDAGLIVPDAYTIVPDSTTPTGLTETPCSGPGMPLGMTCGTAVWGTDIDIDVHNHMPSQTVGYVNLLIDWNQNGNWSGASNCPSGNTAEHVLVDFKIPNPYDGPLSTLLNAAGVTGFTIGPNSGFVWARFSITETPVNPAGAMWDGSGQFEDGETEDYLLRIEPGEEPDERIKFQQLPMDGVMIQDTAYYGHDEVSTVYPYYGDDPVGANPKIERYIGCYMADDFADYEHSPVIRVKWWGSYLGEQAENEPPIYQTVNKFIIAFETDNPGPPSHPEELLQYETLVRNNGMSTLTAGEFTETWISPGGPACRENLFEYEAVLNNPFAQDPNTVYWLKIVAIVDLPSAHPIWQYPQMMDPFTICDFLNDQYLPSQQLNPVTRWGWHNRDYTVFDPYASQQVATPPHGEHLAGLLDDGTEVWHFQDDAVTGAVQMPVTYDNDPGRPIITNIKQENWLEQYYRHWVQTCGYGVDGPPEIEQFSKDLAFQLWTNNDCFPSTDSAYWTWVALGKPDCWCYPCHPFGDYNGDKLITAIDVLALQGAWPPNPYDPCGDFNHDGFITAIDVQILLGVWGVGCP